MKLDICEIKSRPAFDFPAIPCLIRARALSGNGPPKPDKNHHPYPPPPLRARLESGPQNLFIAGTVKDRSINTRQTKASSFSNASRLLLHPHIGLQWCTAFPFGVHRQGKNSNSSCRAFRRLVFLPWACTFETSQDLSASASKSSNTLLAF